MVDVTVTDNSLQLVNSVVPIPLASQTEELDFTYTHLLPEHTSSLEQQPDPQ